MLIHQRLLTFLRPYRRGVVWSFVLAFGSMGATVLLPYLTGRAIDATSRKDRHDLIIWVIAILVAGLARLGLSAARRLVAGRVVTRCRGRPARPAVLAATGARARVLRPPADRAADVARHRRPAVGPLLPRLRPHLHRPVDPDDRARGDRDVRASAGAGGAVAGAGPVRGADRVALRAPFATRASGGAAADRRADRGRGGERLRRPRGQGVRPGGPPARALPALGRARVRPADVPPRGSRRATRR